MIQKSLVVCVLALYLFASCTEKGPTSSPQVINYESDTALMIQVASKFINDANAERVHSAAVATQLTRAMSCTDYNGECTIYGSLISHIIEATADNSVTPQEKQKLVEELDQLKRARSEGLVKVQRR